MERDAIVRDVGPRDGLQLVKTVLPTATKLDWIRADVDGDGVPANVPRTDQSGKAPPQHAYPLFSDAALEKQVKDQERYFFGGAVYNGWSSVPDRYKVDDLNRPDHTHPTVRIFTFSWK